MIQDIYKLNKREEILNKFIIEVINKINLKDESQSQRKLPPHKQRD